MSSVLEIYLKPKIKQFILTNTSLASAKTSSSSSEGIKDISNAIAYGIALSFSSPSMQLAMNGAFIIPPPVPPSTVTPGLPTAGVAFNNLLKQQST